VERGGKYCSVPVNAAEVHNVLYGTVQYGTVFTRVGPTPHRASTQVPPQLRVVCSARHFTKRPA
jgi:hypothetical protein